MSNLLNKPTKKKLLDRGPNITPTHEFTLESMEVAHKEPVIRQGMKKEATSKRKVSTVKVARHTQHQLNALVTLCKADTIGEMVAILVEDYLNVHVTKDEKRQLDMFMDLYRMKDG